MKLFAHTLLAALTLGLLCACGSGSREDGIEVTVTATAAGSDLFAAKADDGEPLKRFRRADGMKIEMQTGLLNLVPLALAACDASAFWSGLAPLAPIGSAQAHAGHIAGPQGAVDVALDDGTAFDLGALPVRPGRYCGLTLQLLPGAQDPLSGIATRVGPCWYPDSVGVSDAEADATTTHQCSDVGAGTSAVTFTLPFTEAITLDEDRRLLALTVTTRYEEWFDGIDLPLLATDATQQARLLDNIATAMTVHTEEQQFIALDFGLKVAGQDAVCDRVYDGLGTGSQRDLRLSGFRYYASDFTLESDTASAPLWLAENPVGTAYRDDAHTVALLGDAQGCEGAAPLRTRRLAGIAPAADYRQLCFTLGVPFELNHTDPSTAPSPLNVTGMSWSWLSGRMFYRFDSVADPDGEAPANFFVHLGSIGCSNGESSPGAPPDAACSYPNRPRICLDYADIDAGGTIVTDIAELLVDSDITAATPDTAPGCMSFPGDPECVPVMPRFGLDYAYDPTTLIPRQEQAVFRVMP